MSLRRPHPNTHHLLPPPPQPPPPSPSPSPSPPPPVMGTLLTCLYCDRTFTSRIGLVGHLRIHHAETVDPVPAAPPHSRDRRLHCSQCPRAFTHCMGLFGHMRIHDSGIHRNADNTETPCTPSAPVILSVPAIPSTTKDIPPASSDFSCPHCAHNFNSRIGLVGHLRIHRTEAGELVPGAPIYSRRGRLHCPLLPHIYTPHGPTLSLLNVLFWSRSLSCSDWSCSHRLPATTDFTANNIERMRETFARRSGQSSPTATNCVTVEPGGKSDGDGLLHRVDCATSKAVLFCTITVTTTTGKQLRQSVINLSDGQKIPGPEILRTLVRPFGGYLYIEPCYPDSAQSSGNAGAVNITTRILFEIFLGLRVDPVSQACNRAYDVHTSMCAQCQLARVYTHLQLDHLIGWEKLATLSATISRSRQPPRSDMCVCVCVRACTQSLPFGPHSETHAWPHNLEPTTPPPPPPDPTHNRCRTGEGMEVRGSVGGEKRKARGKESASSACSQASTRSTNACSFLLQPSSTSSTGFKAKPHRRTWDRNPDTRAIGLQRVSLIIYLDSHLGTHLNTDEHLIAWKVVAGRTAHVPDIVLAMLSSIVLSLVLLTPAGTTQPPFKVIYESPRSPCYTDGKAHQCNPPFTNVAEGIPVVASSTCGGRGRPEEVCKTWREADGNKRTFCEVCDARNSSTARGADRLTDRHVASNQTCWVSDRVAPGSTVNLSLALGKRFEIFYISLQPCGPLPDSIAIYKSSDFGRSWKPWQYFSSDCYRAFGLPTSSEHNVQISSANIQEVLCVALRPPVSHNSMGQTSTVIAFSTIIGRANSQPWSPALIDWMTMTDLQISLSRFPRKTPKSTASASASTEDQRTTPTHAADASTVTLQRRDRSDLYYAPKPTTGPTVFRLGQLEEHARQMQADGTDHPLSTTTMPDGSSSNKPDSNGDTDNDDGPVRFSFSDIAVGGRCKCNGHSNRCVRDRIVETSPAGGEVVRWGPLRCDCQHSTVGADCERCAPGHMDRPWARATAEDANVCKRKPRHLCVALFTRSSYLCCA
ncbi:unnamed protein product [Schistocephalus solidus]|uniref:Netrin-1 n=1 Tax=Schistocephalus solidus TaxID=70667 RepID=A0A183SKM2_SCHSO|nr:unnamed protein product [Schistocephalus solidus]